MMGMGSNIMDSMEEENLEAQEEIEGEETL